MKKVEYVVGAFMPYELDIVTHMIPDEVDSYINNLKLEVIDIRTNPATPVKIKRKTTQTTKKKNKPINEL